MVALALLQVVKVRRMKEQTFDAGHAKMPTKVQYVANAITHDVGWTVNIITRSSALFEGTKISAGGV